MRVWVTRARPDAEATAARLAALGFVPLVAPLLESRTLPDVRLAMEDVAALAFTSRRAVSGFAALTPERSWPVFAVGDATAEAARAAGFTNVRSAGGDVSDLARRIAAERPGGPVLHPGASEPAGDLAGDLQRSGVEVRSLALYETVPLPVSGEALEAWPALHAVLIHSPKAARAFQAAGLPPGPARLLCLSPAVAAALGETGSEVRIAPSPDEASLLSLLGRAAALGAGASSS